MSGHENLALDRCTTAGGRPASAPATAAGKKGLDPLISGAFGEPLTGTAPGCEAKGPATNSFAADMPTLVQGFVNCNLLFAQLRYAAEWRKVRKDLELLSVYRARNTQDLRLADW